MNLNIKVIGAVAAAVVVIAVAAIVLTMGDNDNAKPSYSKDAQLLVFGNADGDRNIDKDDIDVIRSI